MNEGHAAFQVLERCRERVDDGMDFDSALELVAACTVFTTHTPVPAGHDIFDHSLMRTYFSDYLRQLGISEPRFLALGASNNTRHGFNMTALALRGSRFHNGVSRIHGAHRRGDGSLYLAGGPAGGKSPRVCHQRHPRSDLPGTRLGRVVRHVFRDRVAQQAGRRAVLGAAHRQHPGPRVSEHPPGSQGGDARGCPPSCDHPAQAQWLQRVAHPAHHQTPVAAPARHVGHRLRAPLRHLQARDPAVLRPSDAWRAC